MKLIETKTLGTAAASIEFTSIPQSFTDLVVLISGASDSTATRGILSFNTGGTYTTRILFGAGTSADSLVSETHFRVNDNSQANTFGNSEVYIPNYTSSSAKTFSGNAITEKDATNAIQNLSAGLWSGTSAITSMTLNPVGANFVAGSTISLYGITKGSDGITTAS
jgi:hypothetical protein